MADPSPHSPAPTIDPEPTTAGSRVQGPPVTPGKVAIWVFLATEVMFFTGLIGTYIVLRGGSKPASYSPAYPPGQTPTSYALQHPDKVYSWPMPYDDATNPLSIDLTALNTFILICSSVSMVLALAAIQRGRRNWSSLWLLLTMLAGSTFLGIQIYEYRSLMFEHAYPIGVSASGHFTPNVSLFASCFFVMTGFHGAHVAVGVLFIAWLLLRSLFGAVPGEKWRVLSRPTAFWVIRVLLSIPLFVWGRYGWIAHPAAPTSLTDLAPVLGLLLALPWRMKADTRQTHSPVELVGLYWHFVDLVWIILFTLVYLI